MRIITIIICTYNRASLLKQTLDSVGKLTIPPLIECEVVVVDNNSVDETREIVEKSHLNAVYAIEKKQGKTYALNNALQIAKGDILLFTDDDAFPHPDWAKAFIEAANEHKDAGWFGGRSLPLWQTERPNWLRDESLPVLGGYFCLYNLGSRGRFYKKDDLLPIGTSMAVRRSTFDRIGKFREDLGPREHKRGVGDDTELIMRAISQGVKGYYVPEAVVEHFTSWQRLQYLSFFRYGIKKGADQYVMEGERNSTGSVSKIVTQLLRAVPQIIKRRGDLARICLLNSGLEIGKIKASKNKS
jgi:glucosyl-dolichyl phosphate glucuronosyltransferase